MKWKSRLLPALAFAVFAFVGLESCLRGKGPANKGIPVPPRNPAAESPLAQRTPPPPAAGRAPFAQSPTNPDSQRPPQSVPELNLPPGPSSPATPRYLNLQAPPTIILPSDFSIGSLADLSSANVASIDAGDLPPGLLPRLSAFLDDVVSGASLNSLILEGRSPLVAAILADLPAEGQLGRPVSWRLGAAKANGEEAVASFAFFADPIDPSGAPMLPPRCDGILHARLVGSTWYIEDLSFDPEGLSSDRPLPDPPWQPSLSSGNARLVATP